MPWGEQCSSAMPFLLATGLQATETPQPMSQNKTFLSPQIICHNDRSLAIMQLFKKKKTPVKILTGKSFFNLVDTRLTKYVRITIYDEKQGIYNKKIVWDKIKMIYRNAFWDRVSLCCPGWAQVIPTSASHVTEASLSTTSLALNS